MSVTAAKGWLAAGISAGIKESGDPDVALVVSDADASVAGAFTTNRFVGGHVPVDREICAAGAARGFLVNAGISNSATGVQGVEDARAISAAASALVGGPVLVASTGTIGRRVPTGKIEASLPALVAGLTRDGEGAARAIWTTDTRSKLAVVERDGYTVGGMAKGAAMIAPSMAVAHATMLAFITTDALATPEQLRGAMRDALPHTFNAITVDGCTSTCDTVLLLANGACGVEAGDGFDAAVREVMASLARQMVEDAEGATKVVTVRVKGAISNAQAKIAGRAVADSPLMKAAIWGGDPNWGRIAQSLGQASVQLDPSKVRIAIGGVDLCVDGLVTEREDEAAKTMQGGEVLIECDLGLGGGSATILGCDLTPEYVRLNGEYTT